MSLPTRTPAEGVSPARFVIGLSLLLLSLGAKPALATHYVVDPNGGGDFTTIQAAVNQRVIEFRDTILVMPGEYAETITLPAVPQQAWIIGAGGPAVTRLQSVSFTAGTNGEQNRLEDLTFTMPLSFQIGGRRSYFEGCVFEASVAVTNQNDYLVNFENCDFYARTLFYGYLGYLQSPPNYPPFRHLRFHGAPLTVMNDGTGPSALQECTFEGPADTLLWSQPSVDDVSLVRCRFINAGIGVAILSPSMYDQKIWNCTFEDLHGYGVYMDAPKVYQHRGLDLRDSRFDRCGTAVHWVAGGNNASTGTTLLRDTVLASTGNGVELGRDTGRIDSTIVDGSGGHGAVFLHTMQTVGDVPPSASVSNSTFSNNAGDGLRVENTSTFWTLGYYGANVVTDSRFLHNGSAGLRMTCAIWDVSGNVAFENGADGIACTMTVSGRGSRIFSNTSAFNRGEGFRVEGPPAPGDSLQLVQRNISVLNALDGFRVPHLSTGSFAYNDAWGNYLAQYVGGWTSADSNLVMDPRFCDLTAGDLGLRQGSPCGAGGVYGLIGALPETCPLIAGVEPPTAQGVAFSVRPSVARGSVEFVVPPGAGEASVAVYDLAGREVWRTSASAQGGTIRWRGETATGRVRAGLYWARLTRGHDAATRRLVWLE